MKVISTSFTAPKESLSLRIISVILAIFMAIGSSLIVSVAYADENSEAEEAAKSFIGDDDFAESQEKARREQIQGQKDGAIDYNSFSYLINRIFTSSYMNNVELATAASGLTAPGDLSVPNHICDPNDKLSGTPLYHNCDIPNLMGEATQTLFQLFAPQGISGGEKTQNRLWLPDFGLPSNIPGGEVPVVITNDTPYKYTGLEIFGYNMKYTSYNGEWDQINTMNQARMLTNFGTLDYIKLGWNSMMNSIGAAFSSASAGWNQGWEDGGLFGAIGGWFTGLVEGGTSALFRSILDSSDLNVVNTNAWYRPLYGQISYGIRDKTEQEQAQELIATANAYMTSDSADSPIQDEELLALMSGVPSKAINLEDNTEQSYEEWYNDSANSLNKKYVDFLNSRDDADASCVIPTSSSSAEEINAFSECAPGVVSNLAQKDYEEESKANFFNWLNRKKSPDEFREWFINSNSINFNAPWNKYVCMLENGNTPLENGLPINAWNEDGTYNCSTLARVPIQDGLFGNGYPPGTIIPIDTRHVSQMDSNLIIQLLGIDKIMTSVSNSFLSVSAFFTRISNTVLNLAFSPIFEELGVNTIALTLIESFRDGIFAPLLAIAVAGGAIYVLFQAGTKRNYAEQFKNLLLIVGTSFLGVVLLFAPTKMFFWTDEVPSMIETAIMGTIFETGRSEESKLCTATGTTSSQTPGEDLDGNSLALDPSAATRQMMCENWLVYVYSPYVYGQWGTNLNSLNSAITVYPDRMTNTNGNRVGNAGVRLGPGSDGIMYNWAVYQTRYMTAGTATTEDNTAKIGQTDSNLYKIVDLQAGPNNGEGTDSRFFSQWAGQDAVGRLVNSFISIFSSIAGMIAVIAYSLKLLELKLITTLMLTISPFMLLMGVIPGQGRLKLKKYFTTLLVLIIQRIFLVAMLAIMMRVSLGLAMASTGFIMLTMISIAVPLVFLLYRKDILGLIESAATSAGGVMSTPRGRDLARNATEALPTSARNYVSTKTAGLTGGLAGAAAGALAGSKVVKGIDANGNPTSRVVTGGAAIVAGFRDGRSQSQQFSSNRNRRAGLGGLEKSSRAYRAAQQKAEEMFKSKEIQESKIDIEKDVQNLVNDERNKRGLDDLSEPIRFENLHYNSSIRKSSTNMMEAAQKQKELQAAIEKLQNTPEKVRRAENKPLMNSPQRVKEIQELQAQRLQAKADYEYYGKKIADELMKQRKYNSPEPLNPNGTV